MNDLNIFTLLLSTPYTALFMGVCLTVGGLTSLLSMGYYSIFRYPALLYFSISVILTYLILGLANQHPTQTLQADGPQAIFYMKQTLILFGFFFFYKMVNVTFHPHSRSPLARRTFDVLTMTLILVRAYSMLSPSLITIRAASILCILFLLSASLIAITYPAKTTAMRLIKVGCTVPHALILIYPMIRLGIIPPEYIAGRLPSLLMFAITLHSALWFFGLVEMAREAREKAQADSRQNMARTLVHLRDLMESPLEEIEDSVAALGDKAGHSISSVLREINRSVSRLRLIKTVLSGFEKNTVRHSEDDTGSIK